MHHVGEQHRHLLVLRRSTDLWDRCTALVYRTWSSVAIRCRTTHTTVPPLSAHRDRRPRQYRFTAGYTTWVLSPGDRLYVQPRSAYADPSWPSQHDSALGGIGDGGPRVQNVAEMRPRSRPVRVCLATDTPDGHSTIDAMPLQIHTQPDPDHMCQTCGGPSELISQTITPWDGNEETVREVSPWTPRCADPRCHSRRPRHRR
jgi:hypothetical protein